jgi:hypothetical protein
VACLRSNSETCLGEADSRGVRNISCRQRAARAKRHDPANLASLPLSPASLTLCAGAGPPIIRAIGKPLWKLNQRPSSRCLWSHAGLVGVLFNFTGLSFSIAIKKVRQFSFV